MPMRSPDGAFAIPEFAIPDSGSLDFASAGDHAACRALINAGSKTFSAASLLLPAGIRRAAYALYAFCRLSDDLVDIEGGSSDAIRRLRERLDLAYAGRPADSGVDRAFADIVRSFAIPRALPEALIDGLDWDVTGVACEDLTDLYAYAARVAGSVGAMMAVLMGTRDELSVARACDLGVAMQLTNIARDVGEDARAGRLYLPRAWLREVGIDPDYWLTRPSFGPEIAVTVGRLLQAADELYARADQGIAGLPASCRPGIFAARHLYREIGVEVARRGFDSLSTRARVSSMRKLSLLPRALLDAATTGRAAHPSVGAAPPLAETAYLVHSVLASLPRTGRPGRSIARNPADRIIWVAELFASLEARRSLPRDGCRETG